MGHVQYAPQTCYWLKWFFQSVSACVRTLSVLRGGLPEEKNISRCFSDFFPLLLFDFPLTPSPSKRAIFYCVLKSFYWNRTWQRRHLSGAWEQTVKQITAEMEKDCVYDALSSCQHVCCKTKCLHWSDEKIFYVLFHLSAVQEYVMQCNFHPKNPGLLFITRGWDYIGKACAVTKWNCELVWVQSCMQNHVVFDKCSVLFWTAIKPMTFNLW